MKLLNAYARASTIYLLLVFFCSSHTIAMEESSPTTQHVAVVYQCADSSKLPPNIKTSLLKIAKDGVGVVGALAKPQTENSTSATSSMSLESEPHATACAFAGEESAESCMVDFPISNTLQAQEGPSAEEEMLFLCPTFDFGFSKGHPYNEKEASLLTAVNAWIKKEPEKYKNFITEKLKLDANEAFESLLKKNRGRVDEMIGELPSPPKGKGFSPKFLYDKEMEVSKIKKQEKIKERICGEVKQYPTKENLTAKNPAFIRLLLEISADEVIELKLVKDEGGFAFEEFAHEREEVYFLSGRNNQPGETGPFSWRNIHGYNFYQLREDEERIRRHIVDQIIAMKSEDPRSLFQILIAPNDTIMSAIQNLDGGHLNDDAMKVIFDELNRRPSGNSYSILDKLNNFFCAEQTMSLFLRNIDVALPQIQSKSVSLCVFSKWTPCISCATNLDNMLGKFIGRIKNATGTEGTDVNKIFIACRSYSSGTKGYPNEGCSPTAQSGWNLLYVEPRTSEVAVSPFKIPQIRSHTPPSMEGRSNSVAGALAVKPTNTATGLEAKDFVFKSPNTVAEKLKIRDTKRTPPKTEQGTEITPGRFAQENGEQENTDDGSRPLAEKLDFDRFGTE